MRRKEFNVSDKKQLEALLKDSKFMTLCLCDSPYPYAVVLNFVYEDNFIHFHGAKNGRKYNLINHSPLASISVVKPFSFIPSFLKDLNLACPATQFFISAFCEGQIVQEDNLLKKAKKLEILMEKYQDKTTYLNIEENINQYENILNKTALFSFEIKKWSLKLKLTQNLNKKQEESIMNYLETTDNTDSLSTINAIKKLTCKK